MWLCRTKGQQAPAAGITALAVCQRLMHFFRQHLLYETFDVLEPLWRSLDAVLDSGADLDQVRSGSASMKTTVLADPCGLSFPCSTPHQGPALPLTCPREQTPVACCRMLLHSCVPQLSLLRAGMVGRSCGGRQSSGRGCSRGGC